MKYRKKPVTLDETQMRKKQIETEEAGLPDGLF
jgi:hypothetical protein